MALWEYIKAEFAVLKAAPLSFMGLVVLSVSAGIGIGAWHYGERLDTQETQIKRYRVALGIDHASEGALIELNNEELRAKALTVSANLQNLCSAYSRKVEEVQKDPKTDEKGKHERIMAIDKDLSYQFITNLRSDAFNVDNELRRRLGPTAVAAIVGITPSIVADDGTRVDLNTLLLSAGGLPGFNMTFTCPLAGGIEQMAKLLPTT